MSSIEQQTVVEEKKVSRWKDPEWVRTYYREKRRQQRGIVRHVNIMEDGSKWSEHHPYGKFETKEQMLEDRRKYRKPAPRRPKRTCEICQIEVYEQKFWVHEKSIPHLNNLELLKRHGYLQTQHNISTSE